MIVIKLWRIVLNLIHERGKYRYTDNGLTEFGTSDCRLQEKDEYTSRWRDIYLFDNKDQCLLAIEDFQYTLWLAGENSYVRDTVKNLYQ